MENAGVEPGSGEIDSSAALQKKCELAQLLKP